MSKNAKKNIIFGIAFILLIAITGMYIFKDFEFAAFKTAIKEVNPLFIVCAFAMMIYFILAEAWKIQITLTPLSKKPTLSKALGYAMVGFYFSAITPSSTGGQPAQIYYMKRDKINISHSTLTLLVLAIVYFFVMIFFCGFMLVVKFDFISEKLIGMRGLFIFGVSLNLLILLILGFATFSKRLVYKISKAATGFLLKFKIIKDKEKFQNTIETQIQEYSQGAEFLRKNPMILFKIFILTLIQQAAMFLITYFVYKAFSLSNYSFVEIIALQSVLTISVSTLPLPGAVGASENIFMLLFRTLFGSILILPAMLLSRGISFYLLLLVSGIFTLVIHFKKNKTEKIYCKPTKQAS